MKKFNQGMLNLIGQCLCEDCTRNDVINYGLPAEEWMNYPQDPQPWADWVRKNILEEVPENQEKNLKTQFGEDGNDLIRRYNSVSDKLYRTYVKKNNAYGNSFSQTYEKLGIISAITRITDKYNRIVNLVTHPQTDFDDESIKDTLLDMANYCIMTYMEVTKDEGKE